MISTAVMGFSDGHGVVGEVDIAVVAEEFWHVEDDLPELWDLYRCAVAVGASDVEAWRAWRRKLANSLYGEDSYE